MDPATVMTDNTLYYESLTSNSNARAMEPDCEEEDEVESYLDEVDGTMKCCCRCDLSAAVECSEKYPGEQLKGCSPCHMSLSPAILTLVIVWEDFDRALTINGSRFAIDDADAPSNTRNDDALNQAMDEGDSIEISFVFCVAACVVLQPY